MLRGFVNAIVTDNITMLQANKQPSLSNNETERHRKSRDLFVNRIRICHPPIVENKKQPQTATREH